MKLVLFWVFTISFFSVAFAVDQPIKHEQLIKDQLTALNTYRKQHKNRPLVECQLEIGRLYFDQGDFLNALDYDLQALNIAEKIHDSQLTLNALSAIGSIFLIQEDFRKAKAYFLAAENKGRNNSSKSDRAKLLNSLGNVYEAEGNQAKALLYYSKALHLYKSLNSTEGIAICTSNLATVYGEQGNLDLATDYFFKALKLDTEIDSKKGIACDALHISMFYLQSKKYDQAEHYLLWASTLSTETGDLLEQKNASEQLAVLYSETGQFQNAVKHYQFALKAKDVLFSQEKRKALTRLELSFEFEKREAKAKAERAKEKLQFQAEQSKKRIIAGSIMLVLIALLVVIMVLYQKQQLKRKKDKVIFQQETALLQTEKQLLESELINARQLLDSYTASMLEKSQLLEKFRTEATTLNQPNAQEEVAKMNRLNDLNSITILTADDWSKFQALFEQVFTGFLMRLKEKLPHLTQAEIRLICLTKLKLSTKQMADVLAVSPDTIKKTRYRLRKKMLLVDIHGIDELVDDRFFDDELA